MRRLLLGSWMILALLAPSAALSAETTTPSPLEQTRTTLEEARRIVDSERTHDEKLSALSVLLRTFLDTETMGRAALGKHWSSFDRRQQKEFLGLFRELFQRTYVQKLLLFERPDFAYDRETITGGEARVETRILTPRDEFLVSYRLARAGSRWLATDIQIEDMSLTENFRRQLNRLLRASSVEDVLARMRRKYGRKGEGRVGETGL